MKIRAVHPSELDALTDLCLRSKAYWGYDAAFMAACRAELTLRPTDLAETSLVVAERDGIAVGLVQVAVENGVCDLLKLFVEPDRIGQGHGAALFSWAVDEARRLGARTMTIEADPDAVPFYRSRGAREVGTVPSGSIPGRDLPLLEVSLVERPDMGVSPVP